MHNPLFVRHLLPTAADPLLQLPKVRRPFLRPMSAYSLSAQTARETASQSANFGWCMPGSCERLRRILDEVAGWRHCDSFREYADALCCLVLIWPTKTDGLSDNVFPSELMSICSLVARQYTHAPPPVQKLAVPAESEGEVRPTLGLAANDVNESPAAIRVHSRRG